MNACICPAYFTVAVLYNGLARYEEAASAARRSASYTLHPWAMWPLPELVEAAVRMGETRLGRDAFERLVDATQPCSADWAAGIEARCRALLLGDAAAEEFYREAIERLGRDPIPTELARAHLLYGEWLRRQGRRVEAREQLRTAHHMSSPSGWRRSPIGLGRNSWLPAKPRASGRLRRATI